MKDEMANTIDKKYFTAFAKGVLKDFGEAKRLALHQLTDRKGTPKNLKLFAREYLKQVANGVQLTQEGSSAHKAWLQLSESDRDKFWETVGDGTKNIPYRRAQRAVLKRIAKSG